MSENEFETAEPSGFPEASASERSVWDNLRDVVMQPGATFRDLYANPRVLIPLVVILVLMGIVLFFLEPTLTELRRLQVLDRVSEDQREAALSQVEMFSGLVGVVMGLVFTVVFMGIIAFLLWSFAMVTGAGNAGYKTAFGVLTYAAVINVLQGIAQVIVVGLKGAETVAREGGPPTFGLALLMERGDMHRLLYGLLANINFFSIWYAVVVAIGGAVALKMSRGTARAFGVFIWVLIGLFMALQ